MKTVLIIIGGSMLTTFLWAVMMTIASLDEPINKGGVIFLTAFCLLLEFCMIYTAIVC